MPEATFQNARACDPLAYWSHLTRDERADHLPNMRNPEAFDAAVLGFLEYALQ